MYSAAFNIRHPRRVAIAFAAIGGLLAALPAASLAFDEASTAPFNVDASGVALRGHDPVAYFTDGAPVPGSADYAAEHDGATYHFASAANRDAFVADPAGYTPAFGGFCAMGVVMEKKLDGDPAVWRIVDGTLYLNVNEEAQQYWQSDIPGHIAAANANWPRIMSIAPQDL